ncbi:phage antirepressor KilAC domain-containing protein [Streptococcus suis]|uniref:Antirepressor n=1 Tax=Streptococcus suis TaxID=1307 RepID=A0A822W1E7_STRSU|nr:phage antirepressor KilAC domain-containing protein [Streptococcus suis]NRH10732.1 phage antirepressor [Streptococcus suis]CZA70125.1 antirepressor [Streptococcus suis]
MELQIFKNEQFGEVRTADIKGEVYFNLNDCCKILELSNPRKTLERLNPKGVTTSDTLTAGGIQQANFINESNFYKLVFQSRKPEAEKFADWVTSEVLPSIRKHGMFATDELLDNPDFAIATLQKLKEEREAKRILQEQNEVLALELRETKPKAEYYDLMLANKGLIKTSEIAKNYGRSAQSFNKLLNKLKVIYKQGDTWLPYAKYQTHNYVQLEPFAYKNSKGRDDVKMRTKWTMKGHIFLYELLKKHGILPLIEQDITE